MGHVKTSSKTGIGSKRSESSETYRMKRSELRKVSLRQRKRTAALKDKLTVLLTKQVELYGTSFCCAGVVLKDGKCFGEISGDHVIPRSRCPENVDGFWNLQPLCSFHQVDKGSKAIEYRDRRFIEACQMLDAETHLKS